MRRVFARPHQLAKKSRMYILFHQLYTNWHMWKRRQAGKIEITSGSTHRQKTIEESVRYIHQVFTDYLTYADISKEELKGKRILEIGPGDNIGVALTFLCAGAREVVCLDKFFSERDEAHQQQIYRAMREQLPVEEQLRFNEIIDPTDGRVRDTSSLRLIHGVGIEEAIQLFEPGSFDLIVSRAVLEEVYDIDTAFAVMSKLLTSHGMMLHKIDLRDYGLFSRYGHHPLTFLTIPQTIYTLMTNHTARPNRKRINYYRQKMAVCGFESKLFITRLTGIEGDLVPHKEKVQQGIDYDTSTLDLLERIRPHLRPEFREMSDEDLMIAGIFLIARKSW